MDTATLVQVIIAALGVSGLVGSFVAIRKLPGEQSRGTAHEAQINVETMATLRDELIESRDYWQARAVEAEAKLAEARKEAKNIRAGD